MIETIISSPYTEPDHLLTLGKLELEYQVAAKALRLFEPVTEKYAIESYLESFNVENVVAEIQKDLPYENGFVPVELYVIAFRSVLKPDVRVDPQKITLLHDADKLSHAEANILGGLLKYWYGSADPDTGHNLATCWWRNIEDAKKGGLGKAHRESISRTRDWYSYWKVEQYLVQITRGGWRFAPLH